MNKDLDPGALAGDAARSASPAANLARASREMVASCIGKALGEILTRSVDELFSGAEKAKLDEMRKLYLSAMELARDRSEEVAAAFSHELVLGFDKIAGWEASRQKLAPKKLELTLLEHDDLEESLISINLSNSIFGECSQELFGLERRISALLNKPDMSAKENPLGAEVVGSAVVAALKHVDCPIKTSMLLVSVIGKTLPAEVKSIYQDVNLYLVEKGVLPNVRMGVKKTPAGAGHATSGAAQGGMAHGSVSPPGQGPGGASAQAHDPGLFSALRQLLSAGVGAIQGGLLGLGGGGPAGTEQGNFPPPDMSAVHALTRLQIGRPDESGQAISSLGGVDLSDGMSNVLRGIKTSGVMGNMGQMDSMTLDIVAMLFDFILDDKRIPDAMKALIGRLQIPVLKVAMLDKAFFSQKTHPVRKLLDKLAETSIGWNDAEGHESGLYRKVDELVQRATSEFEDNIDLFADLLSDFEQHLLGEKDRVDELTGVSAQLVYQSERIEVGRAVAHEIIRDRVGSHRMPSAIRDFLASTWEEFLLDAWFKGGAEGDAWIRAVKSMDDLLWSIGPKEGADERKKLVGLLPGLLKDIRGAMAQTGVTEAEKERLFAVLVKCHAGAIKSGLDAAKKAELADPDLDAQIVDLADLPELEGPDGISGYTEIDIPIESVQVDPAIVQAVSAPLSEEIQDEGWQTFTICDTSAFVSGDEFDVMVRKLKRGAWIEFEQTGGELTRVKLAWVSPHKGMLLCTNRLGERAASIKPDWLAEKFRTGRAQIIDDTALVDSAVNNLVEQLKQESPESA
ncbi:MAG: DUF1631 domain-containing protein [Sulfuricellaceae bacterium]|nr:DUF1631 domain-containing protein [Sulfuricellaceae bacterium]